MYISFQITVNIVEILQIRKYRIFLHPIYWIQAAQVSSKNQSDVLFLRAAFPEPCQEFHQDPDEICKRIINDRHLTFSVFVSGSLK